MSDRHHPLRDAMGIEAPRQLSLNAVMTPVVLLIALGIFLALFPWNDVDRLAGREETSASWISLNRTVAPRVVEAHFSLCLGDEPVTCVVDGDTIWIEGSEIRIADIDAPEIARPQCGAERELGLQATTRLMTWLNAGAFEVRPNPEGRSMDGDGRKLRVLSRDGASAVDSLVALGVARRAGAKGKRWC